MGRKIVELEVENRGLKAEMEDIRVQHEREGTGRDHVPSTPTSPFGDSMESSTELRRHLQFVEEEAELLRRGCEAERLSGLGVVRSCAQRFAPPPPLCFASSEPQFLPHIKAKWPGMH